MDNAVKDKLDRLIGHQTEFSIMRYEPTSSAPGRILMKILLDGDTQFAAELRSDDSNPKNSLKLLFHSLFEKKNVKGDISMERIMHDAKPAEGSLADFFEPQPGSLYGNAPPTGINAGFVYFVNSGHERGEYFLNLDFYGRSKSNEVSGLYVFHFTDETAKDSKISEADPNGRDCSVIRVTKTNLRQEG